ncbi:Short-chain dehydrogenase/reductase SDR [Penicillium lagena]|uniref:Short-chain dehydrogenase/reductase SDR n=1 Tax=Penicillium lagena TaxID=94218 RepID=UPI002541B245|nr:Short-chain dehydrogenase/reductase SDR [Penicillium lagena]KAJ5620479.1 Short-chain dehydrogenase/reductase SDR [Penicillium lagena]
MSNKQQVLTSEAVLEKYGKALVGKTILITGVSDDSIAGELAVQLANVDPKLLILSARAESKVAPIVEKIQKAKPNVETRFLKMDLGNLSAIRKAVDHDLQDVPQIDHLVCVAGVMACPYSKTVDGFETQFGVNYLANFLLVKLLLPKIKAAGPASSVIIVASSATRQGKIHFDDIGFSDGKTYEPMAAYGQSNVARVMFVKELAERLKGQGVRTYSIDPGAVMSGLQRHFTPEFIQQIAEWRKAGPLTDMDGNPFDIPPWTTRSEGAATMITGMIDPTIADSNGSYLNKNAVSDDELHTHIRDKQNWKRLWDLTEELIQEKFTP